MKTAPGRKFETNMPEGFSAGGMLMGEAALSMTDMTGEDLKIARKILPSAETAELWDWWWKQNRPSFSRAAPAGE